MRDLFDIHFDSLEPAWMRSPFWRWSEASAYLCEPTRQLTDDTDEFVYKAAAFLRFRASPVHDVALFCRTVPEFYLAFRLYGMHGLYCGLRWQLEALIMAGFTDEQLAKMLPNPGGKRTYEIYRKVFFDVADYLDNRNAVIGNIFSNAYQRNDEFTDCDLAWKILGYQFKERFPEFLAGITGAEMPDDMMRYLNKARQARLAYYTNALVNDMRRCYNEAALRLLDMAGNYYKISEDTTRKLQSGDTKKDSPQQLMESLQMAVASAESRLSPIENLVYNRRTHELLKRLQQSAYNPAAAN